MTNCIKYLGEIFKWPHVVKFCTNDINWASFMLGDLVYALDLILTESLGANFSDSNFQDEVTEVWGS